MIIDFDGFFKENQIEYKVDEPLSHYLTFKVGGPCKYMVFPDSEAKAADLIGFLRNNGADYYILGNGSNLLAYDSGYSGVIVNTQKLDAVSLSGETLTCLSGTPLIKVCRLALENSLTGMECLYGIPGTVGGAVYMNAGAYGGEVKDIIVSAGVVDECGSISSVNKTSMDLGYRRSCFSENNSFILSAAFNLRSGDKSLIKAEMNELLQKRKDKQPLEYPSAGSTFKRPEGYYAGALIEESGLKGFSVGGACVSEKHAGFVINKGGATCDDILRVIEHCREKVFKDSGVLLETEVKIIGQV